MICDIILTVNCFVAAGVVPPGLVLPGGISVIPPALPPAPIAVPPLTGTLVHAVAHVVMR
jgi:hypothetical protein